MGKNQDPGSEIRDKHPGSATLLGINSWALEISAGDPDPEDPHVFGPPGSGSISQKYGSDSGSFPFLKKVLKGLK
jgi:hypothetical protein